MQVTQVTVTIPCGATVVVVGEGLSVNVEGEEEVTAQGTLPAATTTQEEAVSKPTAEPTPTATAEGASAETVDQEGAGKEQAAISEEETAPPAAAPEAEPTGEGTGEEAAGATNAVAAGDGEGEGAPAPSAAPEPGPETIGQEPPAEKTSEEGGAPQE